MAQYSFNYNFFFPIQEDGNDLLASIDSRIEEALKLIQSNNDYIVLDDGVQCRTSEELKSAILNRIKSTINVSKENTIIDNKQTLNDKYKKYLLLIIAVCAVFFVVMCLLNLIFW